MLSINGLTYRIGGRVLFDEATAQIGPKRRIGLVGRNGAGKSTLLRLIAGLEDVTCGSIVFDGQDVTELAPAERGVAQSQ